MQEISERYAREAAQGRLVYQVCPHCGGAQAFPRAFCASCGSHAVEWRESAGRGTVAAVTTLYRAPTPDYRERVPYSIALIDLNEGPRVMGHAAPGLGIGDAVAMRIETHGERSLAMFDHVDRRSE